ncbi:hypothetical protein AVEN_231517-1 [Araneus ventricosus]|uniref:Uncharacterized protein n=1 Tax=Araneus ventricosus TaxID=182803 RepID=A0A4Y2IBK3_ARAVE|nr:hypothetical protein AVEN_231517-1 [Araneus ventricosus]
MCGPREGGHIESGLCLSLEVSTEMPPNLVGGKMKTWQKRFREKEILPAVDNVVYRMQCVVHEKGATLKAVYALAVEESAKMPPNLAGGK